MPSHPFTLLQYQFALKNIIPAIVFAGNQMLK